MKVLMVNGSPKAKGNTYTALHEMEKIFLEDGIRTRRVRNAIRVALAEA